MGDIITKSSKSMPEAPPTNFQETNADGTGEQHMRAKIDEEWFQQRRSRLIEELDELSGCSFSECKQRLRVLQLELHPDKHLPESQTHVQKLFCLVQGAWD